MPDPPRPSPAAANLASLASRSNNPSSTTSTALPSARNAPKPTPKRIDYAAELRAPWYRSARSSYLAVGVAVIAAAGSLFGAQLKTTWQEYEAGQTRALAEGGDQNQSAGSTAAAAAKGAASADTSASASASAEAKKAVAGQGEAGDEEISLSDIQRSISTLETVRGQLVQRRIQEELRLQKLHERVAERREVEARRTQIAGPSR